MIAIYKKIQPGNTTTSRLKIIYALRNGTAGTTAKIYILSGYFDEFGSEFQLIYLFDSNHNNIFTLKPGSGQKYGKHFIIQIALYKKSFTNVVSSGQYVLFTIFYFKMYLIHSKIFSLTIFI